ncbi:serine hydrolase [Vampirovibrio chlorellavorus]|uniref:serine hydrolase n=1 Tax=Vampirovibrio chlorellavorus TaxID=758823 RepID=UPI0026F3617A|nr:serine hydrolase [Vampirovibrio chlorellavorus]
MSRKNHPPRSLAARRYHYQKQKQQRLAILVLAALMLLALIGGGIWGALQIIPQIIPNVMAQSLEALPEMPKLSGFSQKSSDTSAFDAYMNRDFGLLKTPSLLYYHNLDYTLLSHPSVGSLQEQLLPVMPVAEDTALKAQLESIVAAYPSDRFKTHLYFYNPQDRSYVDINGFEPVAAASVIKLPLLLQYLMSVDRNVMTIDTPLLYAEYHRAGGSGDLQFKDSGKELTANDVAGQMIRISDNTCTNMMIHYLGGTEAVNQKLANLGLVHTRIRNWLPDLSGTNTISPYEMVNILYNIDSGPLISELSRINGTAILESTHNRHLMVWSLPREARVAHKTGDVATSLGDSGTVYLPDGRRYYLSIQVERPYNDYSVRDLFHRASRLIYDHVAAQPAPKNQLLQPLQLTQSRQGSESTELSAEPGNAPSSQPN